MTKVDENIKSAQNLLSGIVERCHELEEENKKLKEEIEKIIKDRDERKRKEECSNVIIDRVKEKAREKGWEL